MTDFLKTATIQATGIGAGHPLAEMLAGREDIFTMTQQAHDAALTPEDPGGLSHGLRASLARRMARATGANALADHFAALAAAAGGAEDEARVADADFDGGADAWLSAIVRHTDLVTLDTQAVVAGDIEALKSADVSQDDIVRLSELAAFVSYQARVAVGLKLMETLS
jgi:uncharacterized protein YciW